MTSALPPFVDLDKRPAHIVDDTVSKCERVMLDLLAAVRQDTSRVHTETLIYEALEQLRQVRSQRLLIHCPHQWVSLKNAHIQSGSTCTECGVLRSEEPDELVKQFPGSILHP